MARGMSAIRPLFRMVLLALCLAPAACTLFEAKPTLRGNRIDPEQLKELTPGTSTRNDVTALVGSPTVRAPFDDNTWIYISETTVPRIGRTPGVLAQDVVVMSFTEQGVLREIEKKGLDDSRPVDVVTRSTPSPGNEASFLQQLFGNIGRFNALTSRTTGSGGGGARGGAPAPF